MKKKKARVGLLLTLALAAAAAASCCGSPPPPPPIGLPKEVRGRPGEFVLVTAETRCESVAWLALDEGLRVMPPAHLRDTRTAHVFATRPGRYRLKAITCSQNGQLSDWACCAVVISEEGGGPAPPKATR